MCVRYTLHKTEAALAAMGRALALNFAMPEWVEPRYNITLTHVVPTIATLADGPALRGMRWGLVPFYERNQVQGRMLPNAMAEKAATSPAFREAVACRRCLVPANGFYEWQTLGKLKLPHLFTLKEEEPFAFAGVWDPAGDEQTPPAFAILTTAPNALVAPIHDRMPVILTRETMRRWLGEVPLPAAEYQELTKPLAVERLQSRPVSRYVNSSRNQGPQCLEPPEPEPPPEPDLFGGLV